ncbi:lamin tail domain-containing protein [Halosimplex pelagicum]|uniref:Lamin tail domain-containing protein n=1 Tax=Halosimplex pelagicum TaxID=869886 RepID=A0A7D5PAJ7_9EURY|nr:lamin tail domain-containing protein [Halosimplex pelagicum]QLH83441.1 lamin tail domain-containing protein [Halosimplex pelagicum]
MNGRPAAVLAVALLAVLSGCAGFSVSVGEETSTGPTAAAPDVANGTAATVVDVVDGDTIDVRYANGSTDTVRLLGVDTPEVYADNDPAEFEGVPDTAAGAACLESAGEDASAFAERWLAGERVTLVTDPAADRRDRYDRLLAYVHVNASGASGSAPTVANGTATNGTATAVNHTDFTYRLLATGHARVYDSTFQRSERYYAAEADAQADRRGLWRCRDPNATAAGGGSGTDGGSPVDTGGPVATSDPGLTVERVHADAAGNDHENLNDEYVVFGNDGDGRLELGGWTVGDEAGHTYTFPGGFALGPDETVTLRTGSGTNTADTLYWGSDSAVWNNGGDTVVVSRGGETVLRYAY